jgi:sugar O-acyltransferase (sialic acid O-acetyltransferase NeuD family)
MLIKDPIYVIGAGGHARVVVDALLESGCNPSDINIRDDLASLEGSKILGCLVRTPALSNEVISSRIHVAIGSGPLRRIFLERSGATRDKWLTVMHRCASVAHSANINAGSFIAAMAVVGPFVTIGEAVIVNHGAIVDHDCVVGNDVHICPAASLGGGVKLGNRVFIGAGARIFPGIWIGDDAVIGAGAVVRNNVPAGQTWVGVPARQIK